MNETELREIEERAEKVVQFPENEAGYELCLRDIPALVARVRELDSLVEFYNQHSEEIEGIVQKLEAENSKYKALEEAASNFFADYNDPQSDPNYIGVLLIEMEHTLAALEVK